MDEIQYAISKPLVDLVSFYNKEAYEKYLKEQADWNQSNKESPAPQNPLELAIDNYIEQYKRDYPNEQLSDIGHLDNGLLYIATPNILSRTILQAVEDVNKTFKLNIPLGISWIVGRNWKECH